MADENIVNIIQTMKMDGKLLPIRKLLIFMLKVTKKKEKKKRTIYMCSPCLIPVIYFAWFRAELILQYFFFFVVLKNLFCMVWAGKDCQVL